MVGSQRPDVEASERGVTIPVRPELFAGQCAVAVLDPAGRCPQPCRGALKDYPDVGPVGEVAVVLQCSKWCVYGLINTGALKSIRLGRAIRVTRGPGGVPRRMIKLTATGLFCGLQLTTLVRSTGLAAH